VGTLFVPTRKVQHGAKPLPPSLAKKVGTNYVPTLRDYPNDFICFYLLLFASIRG
jgi:hypothetical protein